MIHGGPRLQRVPPPLVSSPGKVLRLCTTTAAFVFRVAQGVGVMWRARLSLKEFQVYKTGRDSEIKVPICEQRRKPIILLDYNADR